MLGRLRGKDFILGGGDRATADGLYASGGWEVLRSLRELPRYSLIAGYCAGLGARSVLDVGCGEGLLAERLQRPPLAAYVGVEISPVAVEIASRKGLAGANFEVGEASTYQPTRTFDAIVFNEMLYYLEAPEAAAERLARALNPGGRIIVSLHRRRRYAWVWRRLASGFEVVDAVGVRHGSGVAWDLKLLAPKTGEPHAV